MAPNSEGVQTQDKAMVLAASRLIGARQSQKASGGRGGGSVTAIFILSQTISPDDFNHSSGPLLQFAPQ